MDLNHPIEQYANETNLEGYLCAVIVLCLLQYALLFLRNRRTRVKYRFQNDLLEEELSTATQDRQIARMESRVLREFVSHSNLDRAFKVLLSEFIPNDKQGFAAYIQLDNNTSSLRQTRGLSKNSLNRFEIDSGLMKILAQEEMLTLSKQEWRHSQLTNGLAGFDRAKADEIHLVMVGEKEHPLGVMMTTQLFPPNAPQEIQQQIVTRLMKSVGCNIAKTQELEQKENQLLLSTEMLQFRAIADQTYDRPLAMIEKLMHQLLEQLQADRAVLILASAESPQQHKVLVQCGASLPKSINQKWSQHETVLATKGLLNSETELFVTSELKQIGIDTLIGGAVTIPLKGEQGTIGVICLTRKSNKFFTPHQQQLVTWASDYLSSILLKVISHASMERQAKQDGLTELANRREFDIQIERAIATARKRGTDCSLLLLDLDKFKLVNDTFGHQAGDEVLKVTARILKDEVMKTRSSDSILVARYGGEEMAVLLPGFPVSGALRVAESLRHAIEQTNYTHEGKAIPVTASIGVATFPMQATNSSGLIAQADTALYEAKETGRNRVCCSNGETVAPA